MPDLLDLTARQVRIDDGAVHKLEANRFVPDTGRVYATACGVTLYRRCGAVLTTHWVTCGDCPPPAASEVPGA